MTPVLPAFADHLWQSLLACGLLALFTRLARPNAAIVRIWLWRVSAAKLLLPFSFLYSLGGWFGFPVAHTADPVPEILLTAKAALTPLFAPAHSGNLTGGIALVFVVLASLAAGAWIRVIMEELRRERDVQLAAAEREQRDPDDRAPGLGFFKAAFITACAASVAGAILLAGAINDRQWRRELLVANALSLRGASLSIAPAAPGMGTRSRVSASENSVLIRNTTLQDLVAIAYGVNHYSVWSAQMYTEDADPGQFWLTVPRYDLRVHAAIREPGEFDPYALRAPITKLLADRYGLEIYVNDRCQPPCGKYGVAQTGPAL